MNVIAIVQARTSSTRLPNKVLLPLNGKTVIENVIDRVKRAKLVTKTILATSTDPSDDGLAKLCEEKGIEVFRGSLNDCLDRFYQAAKQYQADVIVRITGDCPLIDPEIIDKALNEHINKKNDFTCTAFRHSETFPDGEDVDILSFNALERSWKEAEVEYQREHITQYITANQDQFQISNIENNEDLSGKRWTLDEPNDYEFIKAVYAGLGENSNDFSMKDILKYLAQHPEIEELNQDIERNAGLIKSINESNAK